MNKPIIVTETDTGMTIIDYDDTDDEISCIVDEALIRSQDDIYRDDVRMIKNILKKLKLSSQINVIGHEFYVVDCIGGPKRRPTNAENLRIWILLVTEIHTDGPSSNSRRYIL